MLENLTDIRRRVWPLVMLNSSAVIAGWTRGRKTNRRRQHTEVDVGHFPRVRKDPLHTEPLAKRGDGRLATAEAFRDEIEQDPEYGMHLPDAAPRPANRPRKGDVVRAHAVGCRFQALGLLGLHDNSLQLLKRAG